MALKHPTPGLRTIHYWGVSTGKAQINVNLGDELHVPEGVAEQLFAQSAQFKDGPTPQALLDVIAEREAFLTDPPDLRSADEARDEMTLPDEQPAADEAPKPKRSRK